MYRPFKGIQPAYSFAVFFAKVRLNALVSLVWWPLAVFFLMSAIFRACRCRPFHVHWTLNLDHFYSVLVAPFLRPANGVGDTPPLPYYLYCLVGIAIMLFGVCYWAVWRLLLPWILGREMKWTKETLSDGTVLNLVRVTISTFSVQITDHTA